MESVTSGEGDGEREGGLGGRRWEKGEFVRENDEMMRRRRAQTTDWRPSTTARRPTVYGGAMRLAVNV